MDRAIYDAYVRILEEELVLKPWLHRAHRGGLRRRPGPSGPGRPAGAGPGQGQRQYHQEREERSGAQYRRAAGHRCRGGGGHCRRQTGAKAGGALRG